MLRPVLAFLTLGLAAFLLAPTVTSVGKGVEDLNFVRPMPWSLWKRDDTPAPEGLQPPDCDYRKRDAESEITKWPERMTKGEPLSLAGYVRAVDDKKGVRDVEVELFLNETKELPGILLGRTTTLSDGTFRYEGRVPPDAGATKYHLVAHSLARTIGCHTFRESWSDPEMEVTSKTELLLSLPERAILGQNYTVTGQLLDEVGGPVRGANVTVALGDERLKVKTNALGSFSIEATVTNEDDILVHAVFAATTYYGGADAEGSIDVVPEDVILSGLDATRSQPVEAKGRVLMGKDAQRGPIALRFEGIRVATCPTCEPTSTLHATPNETGVFNVTFTVPPTQPPGPFAVVISEGGLRGLHRSNGTLIVPVTLQLEANGLGLFSRKFTGEVTTVDDAGAPVPGVVQVTSPAGPIEGALDARGLYAFGGAASCGIHPVTATYPGDATHRPATMDARVGICGPLAYLPQWVLDTPVWLWPVTILAAAGLILAARSLRERYAPTIRRGPPLELKVTHPHDAAEGLVGVGETLVVTAFLDDPLPPGHTLRVGTFRAMEPKLVGDDLRASVEVTAEQAGDVAVRGEILNERGRVVTRRTRHVRAVRYAAEIERRYRALKTERAGDDLDVITPREFEGWLRERAPDLDPATVRRLVSLFEEADYGPREAGREELLAYLDAERGIPEVSPRAR